MGSHFDGFLNSSNGFGFNDEAVFPNSDQYPSFTNGFEFNDSSFDFNFEEFPSVPRDPGPGTFAPPRNASSDVDSPDEGDFSDTVFKYIGQMLLEEDMEEKPCMFHDPLALLEAEKSFYEVLGEKYPPSPNQHPLFVESPDNSSSDYSYSWNCANNLVEPRLSSENGDYKPSFLQPPLSVNFAFQATSQLPFIPLNSFSSNFNGLVDSSVSSLLTSNPLDESDSVLQFRKGLEEASKFLPSENRLIIDLETYKVPPMTKNEAPGVVVKVEKDEREYSPTGMRGRKNHHREDVEIEEGRSNKQSAVYVEEVELSDMFDRILLCTECDKKPLVGTADKILQDGADNNWQQNGQQQGSNGGRSRAKKQGNKKEVVDLRTLLILCAQAATTDDRRTADELLKQIRQHSSPFGDGSQRLAHYFANGLEARLAGTGSQIYTALASKRASTIDMLKAYQLYISACPFKKVAIGFANSNISNLAEKATTLHIIDFGIYYGFQWPMLIKCLSARRGGPPKLRITGIELPQRGFRPAERVEETGRRLANYCKRFKVPFEYNAIAQKWDTIQIEDLKIDRNEAIAVNCLFRFRNLLDETVAVDSPRNAVLNLIRKINPDIFVHSVVNGSYNAPFFVTRFREALFHFSALFDLFDATLTRENHERLNFEKEFYGREIMNIIACEGSDRVERPETYKQWQVRNMRAGFRQLPLEREIMKKLRAKVNSGYHKDFVVDEHGHWMLQGWKGRIVFATSCWVPVPES